MNIPVFFNDTTFAKEKPTNCELSSTENPNIIKLINRLNQSLKAHKIGPFHPQTLLNDFPLNSKEGILLMILTESIARIPDSKTRISVMQQLLPKGDWKKSDATWLQSLVETANKLLKWTPSSFIGESAKNLTEKGFDQTAITALRSMANMFVYDQHFSKNTLKNNKLCSFDMLGESAFHDNEALHYFELYKNALSVLNNDPQYKHSLSIKLSALCADFNSFNIEKINKLLIPRVLELVSIAKQNQILITIDAEEAERQEITFYVIKEVLRSPITQNYKGLGWVIQAYLKSSEEALDYSFSLMEQHNIPIHIRLVKGAYWDYEIRKAQLDGHAPPVWLQKQHTDQNWILLARKLSTKASISPLLFPMFATHNPHSIACILDYINQHNQKFNFEFQRLHGMGEFLDSFYNNQSPPIQSRIYAPIGQHNELLPYLVRRILENGANSSIWQTQQNNQNTHSIANTDKLLSENIYSRKNSKGYPVWSQWALKQYLESDFNFGKSNNEPINVEAAQKLIPSIKPLTLSIEHRVNILHNLGLKIEQNFFKFVQLIQTYAHKPLLDAVGEVREAIDFCFHHAKELKKFEPQYLSGPSGEENWLFYKPKGAALCIGPFNFPFAIPIGQITAALSANNIVFFKGSDETPIINQELFLLLKDLLPNYPLFWLQDTPEELNTFLQNKALQVIAFTGSTKTSQYIKKTLALRTDNPTLIAETAGVNIMMIDGSAHIDQAARDLFTSAFNYSGQRCSSVRIAFIDKSIAEPILSKIKHRLNELIVENANLLSCIIPPMISYQAAQKIHTATEFLLSKPSATSLYGSQTNAQSNYFMPQIIQLNFEDLIFEEFFGPLLQVCILDLTNPLEISQKISEFQFALTQTLHTRRIKIAENWVKLAPAGNLYLNRNSIGAVVGLQPFGGFGLSGTGPKLGGYHYQKMFFTEISLCNQLSSLGGSANIFEAQRDLSIFNFGEDHE